MMMMVGATNSCPPSATLCIAAHRVALIIFSSSTVVHTTSGSAIAEGPRDVLVSRNSATAKYRYRVALFA